MRFTRTRHRNLPLAKAWDLHARRQVRGRVLDRVVDVRLRNVHGEPDSCCPAAPRLGSPSEPLGTKRFPSCGARLAHGVMELARAGPSRRVDPELGKPDQRGTSLCPWPSTGRAEECGFLGQQSPPRADRPLCLHTRFSRTGRRRRSLWRAGTSPSRSSRSWTTSTSATSKARRIEEYRVWKREHERSDDFPGGESLDDAARRYAVAYRKRCSSGPNPRSWSSLTRSRSALRAERRRRVRRPLTARRISSRTRPLPLRRGRPDKGRWRASSV